MTLIAFATYGADRAEFITDTAWYTPRVSQMGRTTKHLTIAHLDAAVLTQGDSAFGKHAKTGLLDISEAVSTFDELTDVAPELFRMLWSTLVDQGATHEDAQATVFLLGWSDRAERFRAWGYASEHDFAPFKISGLFVTPTPWTMRPSKLELERVQAADADDPRIDEIARMWMAKPPTPAPHTTQEWINLACIARDQRGVTRDAYNHVIVAGDVLHTKLKRGSIETRNIHTFDDADLLRIVEFTEHPLALASPCYCDSGRSYGDCHALEFPCGCRSGKPFGECCGVSPAAVPKQS